MKCKKMLAILNSYKQEKKQHRAGLEMDHQIFFPPLLASEGFHGKTHEKQQV